MAASPTKSPPKKKSKRELLASMITLKANKPTAMEEKATKSTKRT
jgi:hypothetical protein